MQVEFINFIKKHHILNLCIIENNEPYCATCFYAFDKQNSNFIIASSSKSRHIQASFVNSNIAGTIALKTKQINKIQGLQFKGKIQAANQNEKKQYLKTYPFSLAFKPEIWTLHISWAKLTDNTLGFGMKLEFKR